MNKNYTIQGQLDTLHCSIEVATPIATGLGVIWTYTTYLLYTLGLQLMPAQSAYLLFVVINLAVHINQG